MPAAIPLPSREYLASRLDYDPEAGVLRWKARPVSDFSCGNSEAAAADWNAKYAGQEAFTAKSTGYCRSRLLGRSHAAHRVIWKLVTGEEPELIDHINGVTTDNRFSNLRAVTSAENSRNVRRHSDNTSGVMGVYYVPPMARWRATIRLKGKCTHLGYFDTVEEAAIARRAAERRLGFHPNHGRAA